jgi:hypothetical protein
VGPEAFTGAIDLAGEPAGEASAGTGDFRATAASGDGRERAFVRGDAKGSEVVIESRDGSEARRLPVFGPAALAFDPTGDTLGVIAAAEPVSRPVAFPFGPLRLVDAGTGAVRTLIDESVVGFFWSPDGRTIAALRLATTGGSSTASAGATAVAAVAGRRAAAATPVPDVEVEVRLTFIDAASGDVRSDRPVRLGEAFVSTILPYFDQYALSHPVWAPDGTAIVLPLVGADGQTRATVLEADGGRDRPIAEAIHASWAPDGGAP